MLREHRSHLTILVKLFTDTCDNHQSRNRKFSELFLLAILIVSRVSQISFHVTLPLHSSVYVQNGQMLAT